jgi:hypothetical protein
MLWSKSARYAQLVSFAAILAATLAIYGLPRRIGWRPEHRLRCPDLPHLPVVALQASPPLTHIEVAAPS